MCINVVTHTLRVVLVTALLSPIALTEASHVMPVAATMSAVGHDTTDAHDMAGKRPPSHSIDGTSCRIMCLGWVQASELVRPTAPALAMIAALPADHFEMPESIPLSPIGHPPKITPTL